MERRPTKQHFSTTVVNFIVSIHPSTLYIPQIFKTKFYVQKEIEYNFVSTQGSVNQSTLDGWEGYLEQFRDYIIKGTHFSNFAVQASHFLSQYFRMHSDSGIL